MIIDWDYIVLKLEVVLWRKDYNIVAINSYQ